MCLNFLSIDRTKVQLQKSLIYQCGDSLADVFGPSRSKWSKTLTQTLLLQQLYIISMYHLSTTSLFIWSIVRDESALLIYIWCE